MLHINGRRLLVHISTTVYNQPGTQLSELEQCRVKKPSHATGAQDSNPGSRSRDSEALPVSHCALQMMVQARTSLSWDLSLMFQPLRMGFSRARAVAVYAVPARLTGFRFGSFVSIRVDVPHHPLSAVCVCCWASIRLALLVTTFIIIEA